MRRQLMDILVCPACKQTLELKVSQEDDQEILEGTLTCSRCKVAYPITKGIPDLIAPEKK